MKVWEQKLPREQLKTLKRISHSQPWFEVFEVLENIFAILEPYQFQEVISYLIVGDEKALLFDSGNGIGNMKKLVSELTDKEVFVLNSHGHCDHIGSNYEFEHVFVFDHPDMIDVMEYGISEQVLDSAYSPDTYSDKAPLPYQKMVYRRCSFQTCAEGTVIDLGKRRWEVVHAPGHTRDSILLISHEEKIVLTGDTYYPGPLYCFDEDLFQTYIQTIRMCSEKYSDYTLLTGHNEPVCQGKVFKEIAEFFERIQNNEIPYTEQFGTKRYEWKNHSLMKK